MKDQIKQLEKEEEDESDVRQATVQVQETLAQPPDDSMGALVREPTFKNLLSGVGSTDYHKAKFFGWTFKVEPFGRDDFDELLNMPATKLLMADLLIYPPITRLPLTTNPAKADGRNPSFTFLKLDPLKASALAYSLAMLRLRNDYIDLLKTNSAYVDFLIPPDAENKTETAWLSYAAVEAAYDAAGAAADVETLTAIENIVVTNPDMPLNIKASFLTSLQSGSNTFGMPADSKFGYVPFSEDVPYAQLSDPTTGNRDWQRQRKYLVSDDVQTMIRDSISSKAKKFFAFLLPPSSGPVATMPSQYLAAVGEGGRSSGIGASRKPSIGVGYFMYQDYDVSEMTISFPSTGNLEMFFAPYGWDTDSSFIAPDFPEHAITIDVRFGYSKGENASEWIRLTFEPNPNGTTRSRIDSSAAVKADRNVTFSGNRLVIPVSYAGAPAHITITQTEAKEIAAAAKPYFERTATPHNERMYGEGIRAQAKSKMIDEVQVAISANGAIRPHHDTYTYKIMEPTADAGSVFKSGRFFIEPAKVLENRNIEILAESIADRDFSQMLTDDSRSLTLNKIFQSTAGGINPKSDEELPRKPGKLRNKSSSEISKLIGLDGYRNLVKYRSVMGQKSYVDDDRLKKFRAKYEKGVHIENKSEIEKIVDAAETALADLDYVINVLAYTDPEGTGTEGSVFNKDVSGLEKKYPHAFKKAIGSIKDANPNERNDLLSALRAAAFVKLLLQEKAKSSDAALEVAKRHFVNDLKAKLPDMNIAITVKKDKVVEISLGQLK